jgi:hypothetical protein
MATTNTVNTNVTVKFVVNEKGNPPGKLADAELHFTGGPLDGLKLIGFAIWERRTGGRNVTFPARQYSVNGERRSFALLRPVADAAAQDSVRDLILAAYAEPEGCTEHDDHHHGHHRGDEHDHDGHEEEQDEHHHDDVVDDDDEQPARAVRADVRRERRARLARARRVRPTLQARR